MLKAPSSGTLVTGNIPSKAVNAPLRHIFDLATLPRVLTTIVLKILEEKLPHGVFSKFTASDSDGAVFGYARDVAAQLVRSDNVRL